jgi:hypothetical protein
LENEQPEVYAAIVRHIFGVLARAMETKQEKKQRKWAGFHGAMNERRAGQ